MTISNGKETNKSESTGDGRDNRGRFLKGSRGGPGRPSGKVAIEAWRKAFDQAVTLSDVSAVVKQLVKAARGGDKWAMDRFLTMTVGNPVERSNVEMLDELKIILKEKGLLK